ncbi:BTAD domain-containing putative transcriptional regulator [Nocardioides caldifontis]|uniref:BTAD domain-containing putative transcriptional regulator n=1 Tax=Nocardioides caldifontis TaxID=2588938 RepID=UPI0011DFCE7E|nr:BTAD domain-containing putative transcriptional regulator [Nocardioides caldifontis]
MPAVQDHSHHPDATGLERRRLLEPLLDPDGPGAIVVMAPPGSGKTTLLASAAAAAEADGQATAWCPVEVEDRVAATFLTRLAGGLARACGAPLGSPAGVPELLDAVAGTRRPVTVYVDDAHELEGSPAQEHLEALVRRRAAGVRVVVGTRRPLRLNTPRMVVSGELLELDGEALRFRSWEVEELFRMVYGEPLSPEGAAALTRRTGGWAAGLKLFHLATAGKSPLERERAVAELGGRSRLLRSYLTRTVLDELDPGLRGFLLTTSTLGTLTAPLCDALLERDGSAAVLAELSTRQFFIVAAEDGSTFHYHQVMQTLLEGLLVEEVGIDAAHRVYARSGAVLEAAGLASEAVRAYALAEDNASVARLLQQSGAALAADHIEALPWPTDDPWLALARARRLHRRGALSESMAAFRAAERLLDDADFRRRCQEERAEVALWADPGAVVGGAAHRGGRFSLGEALRRTTRRVDHEEQPRLPRLARAVAAALAGDLPGARAELSAARGLSDTERLVAALLASLLDASDTAGASDPSGAEPRLLARLEEIVLTADVQDQPWLARLARGVQATALAATTDQPWRVQSCAAVVEECEDAGDRWGALLLAGGLGWALACRGDEGGAQRWLDGAAETATSLGAPVLGAWAALLGAAVTRGGPDAGARQARARRLARGCGVAGAEALVERLVTRPEPTPPPATAATLTTIRCLGAFEIEVEGAVVPVDALRPLPRSLLMVLALRHGHDVHREDLIEALWPQSTVEEASHRLHAAASSVRRCLADAGAADAVLRRGNGYRLELPGAELDVTAFEDAARATQRHLADHEPEAALAVGLAALELYRGDLVPEAGPQEWVVEERARLRLAAATTACTAGRVALGLGRLEQALDIAHRSTVLDPLRDSAWALLGEVQTMMGDVTAAAATRSRHARVQAETSAVPRGGPARR